MSLVASASLLLALLAASPPPPRVQLAGIAQDIQGRPLASAEVLLLPNGYTCGEKDQPLDVVLIEAKTDESGLFLVDVSPAQAPLSVLIRSAGLEPRFLGPVDPNAEPVQAVLGPGSEMSGQLVEEGSGSPVAGAIVRVLPSPPASGRVGQAGEDPFLRCARANPGSRLVPSVTTGGDGSFLLEGLAPGLYTVRVEAPLHVDLEEEGVLVVRGSPTSFRRGLRPAGSIEGTAQDAEGRPIEGVEVRVLPGEAGSLRSVMSAREALREVSVKTGADGAFRLDDLPAGTSLRAAARRKGLVSEEVPVRALARGESRKIAFTMRPGVRVKGTVVDETGEGVSNASVALREPDENGEGGILDRRREGLRAALTGLPEGLSRTDAEGKFEIEGVAPGTWQPLVFVSGVPRRPEGGLLEVPAKGLSGVRMSLVLGPALRGTVTDESGAPLAGALVRGRTGRRMGGDFLREESGPDGRFVLRTGEADLLTMLRVSHEGYAEEEMSDVLVASGALQIVLPRSGGIEGKVRGPDGNPLAAFRVRARRREEAPSGRRFQRHGSLGGKPFYDEGGAYRLEDIAPGTYDVTVEADGLAPARLEGIEVVSGVVAAAPTAALSEGMTISGVVVEEGGEVPVAGARVSIDGPVTGEDAAVETDATGRFLLKGVPPGVHVLQADHDDYPPATVRGVRVAEGEEPPAVTIRLQKGGAVEGTVSISGLPVSGATVEIGGRRWFGAGGQAPAATDGAGRYRIFPLAAGIYTVTATLPGGDARWKSVEIGAGETVEVDFGDETPGSLEGSVLRAGEPVAGASLLLFPAARGGAALSARESVSGDAGGYAFAEVAPGDYRLAVVPPGSSGPRSSALSVQIGEGESVRRDVDLPALELSGRVVDGPSGDPVPGASVTAWGVSDRLAPRSGPRGAYGATTDATGAFRIDLPAPGTYGLAVQHSRHVRHTEQVEVAEEGRTGLEVEIQPSDSLRGRLVDEGGLPLAGALVLSAGFSTAAITDEGGRFVLGGLGEDPVTLRFLAAGAAPTTVHDVRPEEEETTWTLHRGGALTVRIAAAPPALEAGTLRLVGAEGTDLAPLLLRSSGITGVDNRLRTSGFVRFPQLEPGSYQVVFQAAGARATAVANVRRGDEAVVELRL